MDEFDNTVSVSDKPRTGEIHRRQRKVMAGAFSVPHLKAFLTRFQMTASKARGHRWNRMTGTLT